MDILESFHLLLPGLLRIATMTAMPIASVQFDGAALPYYDIYMTSTYLNFSLVGEYVGI